MILRSILSFFSVLAFGAMTAAALVALLPSFAGHAPAGLQAAADGLQFESLLIGMVLGLTLGTTWSLQLGRHSAPDRDVVPRARAAILLLLADRDLRRRALLLLRAAGYGAPHEKGAALRTAPEFPQLAVPYQTE